MGWAIVGSMLLSSFPVVQSLRRVWLPEIPRTVARQAPLSTGFPRQEPWSGLPRPSPGLPSQGRIPRLLHWRVDSLPPSHQGRGHTLHHRQTPNPSCHPAGCRLYLPEPRRPSRGLGGDCGAAVGTARRGGALHTLAPKTRGVLLGSTSWQA